MNITKTLAAQSEHNSNMNTSPIATTLIIDYRKRYSAVRMLDILGATTGLVLSAPLFALVALLLKITSPGPVFYRASRIGYKGGAFTILKFRSMTVDADKQGAAITSAKDSRITPIGQVLRKWKLDELPQFINILIGNMSLVGARPEAPNYVDKYNCEQLAILDFKPGLTSPASMKFRDESSLLAGDNWEEYYTQEIMPAKLEIDLRYLKKRSVWTDIIVILRTVIAVVRRQKID